MLSFGAPSEGGGGFAAGEAPQPRPRPPATRIVVRKSKKRGRRLKNTAVSKTPKGRPHINKDSASLEPGADRMTREEQGLLRRLTVMRVKKASLQKRLKRIAKQTRLEKQASIGVACDNAAGQARSAAVSASHCVAHMFANEYVKRALTVLLRWHIIHDVAQSVVSEYISVACKIIVRTRQEAVYQNALAMERIKRFEFAMPTIEEKKSRAERLAATRIQTMVRQRQAVKAALALEDIRDQNRQQQILQNSMDTLRQLVSSAKTEFDTLVRCVCSFNIAATQMNSHIVCSG